MIRQKSPPFLLPAKLFQWKTFFKQKKPLSIFYILYKQRRWMDIVEWGAQKGNVRHALNWSKSIRFFPSSLQSRWVWVKKKYHGHPFFTALPFFSSTHILTQKLCVKWFFSLLFSLSLFISSHDINVSIIENHK
jgi:hypothetical protein